MEIYCYKLFINFQCNLNIFFVFVGGVVGQLSGWLVVARLNNIVVIRAKIILRWEAFQRKFAVKPPLTFPPFSCFHSPPAREKKELS